MSKHTVSFQNAFRGIWTAITTQSNIRIHFLVASFVLLAGVYLRVSLAEVTGLLMAISLVVFAEMINTSIELLGDAITLKQSNYIMHAKDVSAGAVLLSAIFALLIGLIVFIPKIIAL